MGPKIALAQIRSSPGQIESNITKHLEYIREAAALGADLIAFPELSITGYEPDLAVKLATTPGDVRFFPLQELSNQLGIQILAGMPIIVDNSVRITTLIFTPNKLLRLYFKSYLHPDEEVFFTPGKNADSVFINRSTIAPAICYEISVPQHISNAMSHKPEIYLAMVVKSDKGMASATEMMSSIARTYGIKALLVNAVGPSDGSISAGQSAVWDETGQRIKSLGENEENLLLTGGS